METEVRESEDGGGIQGIFWLPVLLFWLNSGCSKWLVVGLRARIPKQALKVQFYVRKQDLGRDLRSPESNIRIWEPDEIYFQEQNPGGGVCIKSLRVQMVETLKSNACMHVCQNSREIVQLVSPCVGLARLCTVKDCP